MEKELNDLRLELKRINRSLRFQNNIPQDVLQRLIKRKNYISGILINI